MVLDLFLQRESQKEDPMEHSFPRDLQKDSLKTKVEIQVSQQEDLKQDAQQVRKETRPCSAQRAQQMGQTRQGQRQEMGCLPLWKHHLEEQNPVAAAPMAPNWPHLLWMVYGGL